MGWVVLYAYWPAILCIAVGIGTMPWCLWSAWRDRAWGQLGLFSLEMLAFFWLLWQFVGRLIGWIVPW